MHAQQFYQTFKFNSTTKKLMILLSMSAFLWLMILTSSLWSGQLHHGHFPLILHLQWNPKWIMSKLMIWTENKFLLLLSVELNISMENKKTLLKLLKSSKEKTLRENHTFQFSTFLSTENKIIALKFKWPILSQMILVQGLYIALQVSVKRTINYVWKKA
jgi:hypothetical protein